MLHEGGLSGPSEGRLSSRIVSGKDCSINRENPNRKLPSSSALVVGFDGRGHFSNIIPNGLTHGYWTLSQPNTQTPDDGAGHHRDYISRSILEFDLNNTGITSSDDIDSAYLYLYYYMSHTIQADSNSYIFDIHRIHPGGITNTAQNLLTENATWWEYDFSGTATGATEGSDGSTGTFNLTEGGTHGINMWEYQGLGISGSTAEHIGDGFGGPTGWVDFSGGVFGSNQDEYSDEIYNVGHSVTRYDIRAGKQIQIDVTEAARDALENYNNKLRLMIKLRDDHTYDNTNNRIFLSFYSSESEYYPDKINNTEMSEYSPVLHITYWDNTP